MRIAIDYTAAVNQSAGIGRYVRSLVHALAELDSENDYVLLYPAPDPGRSPAFPEQANFRRRQLPVNERMAVILWHRLRLPLPADWLTGPIDVFHGPDFLLPPVRRARSVAMVHDLAFLVHPECAHAGLRAFLERTVPRSLARADCIVANSENTRTDVVRLIGIDPARVFVVPEGVDATFRPASQEAVQQVCETFNLSQPYVLAVGTIEPRKNYPRLIQAYGSFRDRAGLPCALVIAGREGWLTDETFDSARRSPYRDDIRFTGPVPDKDLIALYTGAAAFAYPSIYEGFGLPVLEAMACGTPVVCSNTSSLPEFAEGAALLVSPEDPEGIAEALARACTDERLRDELRAKGAERAARYPWRRAAEAHLEIYGRLVNQA